MRNIITVTLCGFALAGCSLLFEDAAEEVARGIVKYCDTEPAVNREAYRAAIQAELPEGYSIDVVCPGDVDDS